MASRMSIIVAAAQNRVIGSGNRLPWHIPEDFAWFKRHTRGHPVIMGRKTYESIGGVLPDRKNIIITRNREYTAAGAYIYNSLEDAVYALEQAGHEEIFIIGGNQIFNQSMDKADRIYLTLIHRDFEGDIFMPEIPLDKFTKSFEEYHTGEIPFTFFIYDRKVQKN
jgi:dihydrofolate reductase